MSSYLKSTITTGQAAPENRRLTPEEAQREGVVRHEEAARLSATKVHWLLQQALAQAQPVLERQPTVAFDAPAAAGHVGTQAAVADDATEAARAAVAEAYGNA